LGHYQRSLEVSERLLAANTNSAQAARDVSVNLNKLGAFLAARGQPGDAEKALGHYQRSLEVRERLLAANTNSAQAARDVMVSHYKLHLFYRRQADEQKAAQSLKACFNILDSFVRAGRPMDAQMRRLYDQLKPQFSSGSNQPSQGHSDEHDPTAR
jgi:tetratricopeptide (TPR) repeat protein